MRKRWGVSFLRYLGLGRPAGDDDDPSARTERAERSGGTRKGGAGRSASVRAIAARLERLPADRARYLAGFAYVLARVADADLDVHDRERDEMVRIVAGLGGLSDEQARIVVEIAGSQARELGATQNYLVTREFREHSTREQRAELLHCLFAVAAADGEISGTESDAVLGIAEELGFTRREALGVRSHYREHLEALRGLPRDG